MEALARGRKEHLMAKLIVVTRERLEISQSKLEKLLSKDEWWQEEKVRLERDEAEEKKRRNAEYSARPPSSKESREKGV